MSGKEAEQKQDVIILSVKLRSGGFESSIEVPVNAPPSDFDGFVQSWLKLMEMGIKIGQERKP